MNKINLVLLTILLALLALVFGGCASPLDTDAPRKETPITPAIKVTPRSVVATFTTAQARYVVKGLPTIKIDTSVSPMRFWIDVTMEAVPGSGPKPLLLDFRTRLDSFPANGLIADMVKRELDLYADFGPGRQWYPTDTKTNTASVVIAEHPREEGKPRMATITIYIIMNKDNFFAGAGQQQILGTIVLEI